DQPLCLFARWALPSHDGQGAPVSLAGLPDRANQRRPVLRALGVEAALLTRKALEQVCNCARLFPASAVLVWVHCCSSASSMVTFAQNSASNRRFGSASSFQVFSLRSGGMSDASRKITASARMRST